MKEVRCRAFSRCWRSQKGWGGGDEELNMWRKRWEMLIVFIRCSLSLSLSLFPFEACKQLHFKSSGCLKEILLRGLWPGTVRHAFSLFASINAGLTRRDKYTRTNRKGVGENIWLTSWICIAHTNMGTQPLHQPSVCHLIVSLGLHSLFAAFWLDWQGPQEFQVSSFKFYLSHTRLYRDCITSSEMRVGSAPWTVQI